MKTPEEIIIGLRRCFDGEYNCNACPYHGYSRGNCIDALLLETHAYITQLKNQLRDATKKVSPSESSPKWISVKDALPTSAGKYLVNIRRHRMDDEDEDYEDFVTEAWYNPIPLLICNQSVGWSLLHVA